MTTGLSARRHLEEQLLREWLDTLQLALDIVGVDPTIGTAADAANVVISLLRARAAKEPDAKRRHQINAGMSAVSLIPGADLIKLLKWRKANKIGKGKAKPRTGVAEGTGTGAGAVEAVFGVRLSAFDDLPQFPNFHGMWVLPSMEFILVESMEGEMSHVQIAQTQAEADGARNNEAYEWVIEELGWVRVVFEAGVMWCDPPSKGWRNAKQRRLCEDIAMLYELELRTDIHDQ